MLDNDDNSKIYKKDKEETLKIILEVRATVLERFKVIKISKI